MSENTYEVRYTSKPGLLQRMALGAEPVSRTASWQPVTFEQMWQDLKYSRNELAPDALIVKVDNGEIVSSDIAEYRKADPRR